MSAWNATRWHSGQTKRWNKLERCGWQFSEPRRRSGQVGLQMKGLTTAVFYVPLIWGPLEVHTALLACCEAVNKATISAYLHHIGGSSKLARACLKDDAQRREAWRKQQSKISNPKSTIS